jgi:hypothetical protein
MNIAKEYFFFAALVLAFVALCVYWGLAIVEAEEKFQTELKNIDHGGHLYIYSRYSSGYFLHAPDCPCFSGVEGQP